MREEEGRREKQRTPKLVNLFFLHDNNHKQTVTVASVIDDFVIAYCARVDTL